MRRNLWPGMFVLCLLACGDDADTPSDHEADGGKLGAVDASDRNEGGRGGRDGGGGDGGGSREDAGPTLDGSQALLDASMLSDGGESEEDGGHGDGGLMTPPGSGLVLPVEGYLITRAHPYLGSGGSTKVTIGSNRRYAAAYSPSTQELYSGLIVYRFVPRAHQAPGEWPGNGIKVFWQRLDTDSSDVHSYLCVRSDPTYGSWALTYGSVDDVTGDPEGDTVDLDYCSWTLVKHPTEDTYALRAAFAGTELEYGRYVTDGHASTAVANTVRVDSCANDLAAYFELLSPIPATTN